MQYDLYTLLTFLDNPQSKNSRVDASQDAVEALNHYTVPVGLDEVFIQENSPHGMEELAFAVGQVVGDILEVRNFRYKFVKRLWELPKYLSYRFSRIIVAETLTGGMKAIGWQAWPSALSRAYFERLPKNK